MTLLSRKLSTLGMVALAAGLFVTGFNCQAEPPVLASAKEVTAKLNPPALNVPHVAAGKLPRMDGDPADPAWKSAALIDGLSLSLSAENLKQKALPTQVRLLWSEDYLYIRYSCEATEPAYTPEKGRDAMLYKGDAVEVFLDAKGDGRQYFELQANVNNDLFDQQIFVTGEKLLYTPEGRLSDELMARDWWGILEWTMPGLKTAASPTMLYENIGKDVRGWTVDFAIPASAALQHVGLQKYQPMTLRAHLIRYAYPADPQHPNAPRKLLAMNWAPVVFGCPHVSAAAMGYLKLLPAETKADK